MASHEFTPGPWCIKPSEEIPSPYLGKTSSTRITILDAPDGQVGRHELLHAAADGFEVFERRGAAQAESAVVTVGNGVFERNLPCGKDVVHGLAQDKAEGTHVGPFGAV